MASYRLYPPPPLSTQNPLPPPPPPLTRPPQPQAHGSQYPQNWVGSNTPFPPQNYTQMPPNSSFQHGGPHSYPFQPPPPPPPPPESSDPPPPPPPTLGGHHSSITRPINTRNLGNRLCNLHPRPLRALHLPVLWFPHLPHHPLPPPQVQENVHNERDRKKVNASLGRVVETEEERQVRKKREMEKIKLEEKRKPHSKEAQYSFPSGVKGHGSVAGLRVCERRVGPVIGVGDRDENPLKRQTTFMCRMKFRNELPDPSAQPKLMNIKRDKDRFTHYTITLLEKMHKPKLYFKIGSRHST